MTDLKFMIVNSNLQHAQHIIHELKNRVSFDVYQDTKEKNIWGLLDGGKDDIYVYDRCGRLAYYIPFPLSIMNNEEGSLVTSAILATYYRSPCGSTCEKNSSTLEDFLNNVDRVQTPVDTTTEKVPITTTELYKEIVVPDQTENVIDLLETSTSSIIDTIETKSNHSEHFSDIDYPTYDEALEDYDNNETNPKHDHAFFNTLYNYFFNSDTTEQPKTLNTNETISVNASSNEFEASNKIFVPLNISENEVYESYNTTPPEMKTTTTPKPKPDRCAEVDPSVCRDWSKKRLLRAHNCCSSLDSEDESRNQPRFCKNFGKKRCKKIKTILKCCIKTALFEATTLPTAVDEVEDEVVTTTTEAVTIVIDLVCCRDVEDGKLCRVSEEPTCEVGEYVQESVPQIESAPMEERTM